MKNEIVKLDISDYKKCSNIWDMKKQSQLAQKMYEELLCGNRITYIYKIDEEFVGEISIVKEADDPDYTVPNKRVYISRLIVKNEYRRQGIGKKLVEFIIEIAKNMGYSEISIGVDLDNYPALRLYVNYGFDKIVYIGEDEYGKYLKLLKILNV